MVETICDQLITFRFLSKRSLKLGSVALNQDLVSNLFRRPSAIPANALEMSGNLLPIWGSTISCVAASIVGKATQFLRNRAPGGCLQLRLKHRGRANIVPASGLSLHQWLR
jgi:hypothetical protein